MKKSGFSEAIAEIVAQHPQYDVQAYLFVREALEFTIKLYAKPLEGAGRHVSGMELLEGLRRFALQEFGPMAMRVLHHWGIRETRDFGQAVFNMVDKGILGKTEEDRIEDFEGGYDFDAAFRAPFLAPIEDDLLDPATPETEA